MTGGARRLLIVDEALRLIAAGRTAAEADAEAAAAHGVSPQSVARWRRRLAKLEPEQRLAALEPRGRGGRPSHLGADEIEYLAAQIVARDPHWTCPALQRELLERHGHAPHIAQIQRFARRFRAENARLLSISGDPDGHRSRRRPAFGDADSAAAGLNDLWELDSTIADVMCADGRRRALCAVIDVWSRRCLFAVADTSRAIVIAALLRRAIIEWGKPNRVRVDRGRDYTSRLVSAFLAALEIEAIWCTPYAPYEKPFVERLIGTISTDLFAHLPGHTGRDLFQRKKLEARRSFAERRGEAPAALLQATLTPEKLQERIDTWAETLYGRRTHGSLGMSPFEKALSGGPPRKIADPRALDVLLEPPEPKRVTKKGIRIDRGRYVAELLGDVIGEWVEVRRDRADYGRIHVFLHDAFLCTAEDPDRTGADRAEIAAAAQARARAADREDREFARELRRRWRPEEAMDRVLAAAAAGAEKVVALPRRGATDDTPALAAAAEAAGGAPAPNPQRREAPRVSATITALRGRYQGDEE